MNNITGGNNNENQENIFEDKNDESASKIIVFTQYRDTLEMIHVIKEHQAIY